MPASVRLPAVLDRLREKYGQPASPPVTDLFEQVLLTQVAYLAKDKKRLAAFEALRDRVGLSPEAILAADPEELEEIARLGGGVAVEERAERMRASARLVQDAWGGSLSKVLDLPTDEARKALETFAMVGRPGAEVMLSIAGAYPDLALDSNGLRVLVRLGYGDEQKSYDRYTVSAHTSIP